MRPRLALAVILTVPALYVISSGPALRYSFSSLGFYGPILSLKLKFPDSVGFALDKYWQLWGVAVKLEPSLAPRNSN